MERICQAKRNKKCFVIVLFSSPSSFLRVHSKMAAASSPTMAPGRPRRQQAYRRANTSLALSSISAVDSDPDPYISCTSILDRFGTGSGSNGPDTSGLNGNRKMSAGAIKDFLLGRRDQPSSNTTSSYSQYTGWTYLHATTFNTTTMFNYSST